MKSVSIIDYGIGNLHNVARAFQHIGTVPHFVTTDAEILASDILVLPGVGAFEPCLRSLKQAGLDDAIKTYARSGRKFLGICVGMQMLFDESREFGVHQGLGLIPGVVAEIPRRSSDSRIRKVPHIGWSPLGISDPAKWSGTILDGLRPGVSATYFVHSFSATQVLAANLLAEVDYNGYAVCAAVRKDNIYGVQFHPEKSGEVGLAALRNFAE